MEIRERRSNQHYHAARRALDFDFDRRSQRIASVVGQSLNLQQLRFNILGGGLIGFGSYQNLDAKATFVRN
jgi:hypothetical protein